MARTKRESDNRRREENGRLVGAAETSKERVEWCRFQRKNFNILGLPKRKEWSQCHKESNRQERRSPLAKRKRNRAVCPKHQIMRGKRVKVGESCNLAREGGSEREHGEEWVDSTVNEGRFQGEQGGQARRASLEQVEGSMSG